MKITISGELGGGKTVLGKQLCEKMGYSMVSVGSIQRELAAKHGMTTIEFNKYMETHPEIDHECDNKVVEYGQSDTNLVLDSRLAWHFVPRAFKIHLVVNINIAASRIFNDTVRKNEKNTDLQDTVKNIRIRKASECKRFKEQYNLDIDRLANYDLVVDSSFIAPEDLADFVIAQVGKHNDNSIKPQIWLSPTNIFPLQNIRELTPKYVEPVQNSIQANGYNEQEPIQVVKWDNAFFIFDGHKRCCAAIATGMKLIPVTLVNADSDTLPSGQSIEQYVTDHYALKNVYDWEDMHQFHFADYYQA